MIEAEKLKQEFIKELWSRKERVEACKNTIKRILQDLENGRKDEAIRDIKYYIQFFFRVDFYDMMKEYDDKPIRKSKAQKSLEYLRKLIVTIGIKIIKGEILTEVEKECLKAVLSEEGRFKLMSRAAPEFKFLLKKGWKVVTKDPDAIRSTLKEKILNAQEVKEEILREHPSCKGISSF